ncbi:spondin-2-like isoform X1 [Sycon ciliatum]|uniref:spondin-2-like isoform X1 n=1 Tax=Sycon ciliatum TaxID=27933 RepID=UPI0031F64167
MAKLSDILCLAAILAAANIHVLHACNCSATGTATYTVTFESQWTLPTPPTFAHWSPPIGTSHSACYVMWRRGTDASTGMEAMAELGRTGSLKSEFTAQGADTLDTISGIPPSVQRSAPAITFTVDRYRPYVSVTSMIAPSPDWFVGVDTLDLCDDSSWVNEVVRPAFPYDAGTDNGLEFGSLDIDKSPREKIARITSTSPNTQSFLSPSAVIPMGNFKFTFVSMAATPAPVDPMCSQCPVSSVGGDSPTGSTGMGTSTSAITSSIVSTSMMNVTTSMPVIPSTSANAPAGNVAGTTDSSQAPVSPALAVIATAGMLAVARILLY